MKKMLIADATEINRSILYSIFASQYELLQVESSDEVFRILMEQNADLDIVLIHEKLAGRLASETIKTLSTLKIFDRIPFILILEGESFHLQKDHLKMPFSDVISSPVNPYIVKRRVSNIVELFAHKNELESLVEKQTKEILEQNRRLKNQQQKINTINNDMLDTLSTVIEYRDVESGKHIHRIRKFTEALLRVLAEKYPKYNLTEEKIELISSASSIHDIGKIAIPDAILLSPNRLSYEEFRVMKQHTIKGCEILEQLDTFDNNEYYKYCYDICRYHHEKWDGLGYPDGLIGDQIPIWAQVVSMADCYDALTSERPYKSAFSHDQAVEMIRSGACGCFSDEMMDCFSAVLPKFKEYAVQYADEARSESFSDRRSYAGKMDSKHERDVYLKMDRNALIDTIEQQKKMLSEGQKRDREILYKASDYVFEFDFRNDTLHERKGSIKDICGYIPKNYEEAVGILSDCCAERYKNRFVRTFRIQNIMEKLEDDAESIVLECPMELGDGNYSNVRCSVIPQTEDEKLTRLFMVMSKLHDTVINNSQLSDLDSVTGLWNYNGISREVDDFIEYSGKNGYHSLLLIDIDDFKKLNRLTDYNFGNDVLCDISEILKQQTSNGNILGRIEDDNFIVFLNDCPDEEQRMELIEDVFRCLHKSYEYQGEVLPPITASMGIASYPKDGKNFDELFRHASKAVEIVKLNGKNMYLFYNKSMSESWELKKYDNELEVRKDEPAELMDTKEYFIPIIDSGSGRILSYDMIELNGEYLHDMENALGATLEDGNITALSLNNIKRLLSSIYSIEQDGISLPDIAVFTLFDGKSCDSIIGALDEIIEQTPVNTRNICLMISHEMLDDMSINDLKGFVSSLRGLGFRIGLYNVGINSVNINCFIEKLFDRIMFASSFLHAVEDGIYSASVISELIHYFARSGAYSIIPGDIGEELISELKPITDVSFGVHKKEFISIDDFRLQMKVSSVIMEYPILSHEHTEIVPNEKMYDEILTQTRSFILEWTPRFDSIKLSGSFRSMYGYMPDTDDFVKDIRDKRFIHPDDIGKLLEKMNNARSENSETEAFIRVYRETDDSYVWNRVHFVIMRNPSKVPVKVISVFTDISYERESGFDENRRDKTDFITNLYNKHATENKIKSYIYDEGAGAAHALILAEICGYDQLDRTLGTVFANAVLKEIAANIRELFRDSDIIGRSSGNRFIVFVKGMNSRDKILEKAEQICKIISNKYQSEEGDISIFGKAGIGVFPSNGSTYDELYAAAMRALYFAKHNIKSNACFAFDADADKKLLHD